MDVEQYRKDTRLSAFRSGLGMMQPNGPQDWEPSESMVSNAVQSTLPKAQSFAGYRAGIGPMPVTAEQQTEDVRAGVTLGMVRSRRMQVDPPEEY